MSETTTLPEFDLVAVNKNIAAGLARVEEVKQLIEVYKEESLEIRIKGSDDNEGYLATKDFLSKVRPTRTGLEKERKSVVKPFNDLVDVVNTAYKKATTELAGIEAPHKSQKEEYEAAEERRKAEELAAREKVINDKIALLLENGLEYNPLNGCYTNTSGRAVTRMDITNMPMEDFDRLLDMVTSDFEKTQSEIQEQKRLDQQIRERKIELTVLQIPQNLEGFIVTDVETEIVTFLAMEDINSEIYDDFRDKMVSVLAKNKHYYNKIKEDAARAEEKRIEDEKALADRERKIAEAEEKIMRAQLDSIKSKMNYFSFLGNVFRYIKSDGSQISVPVEDIINDETLIESLNEAVAADVKLVEEEAAKKAIDDNLAEQKRIEQEKKDTEAALKLKLDAEAKQKRLKNKDILQIDPCVAEIFSQLAEIKKMKFEVIGEYATKLIQSLESAIDTYNNDLRHLR